MGTRPQTLDDGRRQLIRRARRADLGVQQAKDPFSRSRGQKQRDIDARWKSWRAGRRQERGGEIE
jgi:hypothetical protein